MPTTATIAGTTVGTPNSNMSVGNTGSVFLSWMASVDGVTNPNTYDKIFQQYGRGLLFRDMLRAKGQEIDIPANDLNVIEEQSPYRPIKLRDAIAAGAAGAALTAYLHSDNYESTKIPVQLNDKVLIPAQYLASGQNASAEYIVTALATDVLTNDTLTLTPMYSTSDVDTTIPAGTELAVGGNAYARGTGQPYGTNTYPVNFSYTTGIVKKTFALEQDVLATKNSVMEYNGKRWIINRRMIEAERDLEFMEDANFHHGQKNSNTSVLVSASGITGDDGIIRSTDGITTLMDQYSMCDYYDTTFDESHLDNVHEGFVAQGLPTADIAVYCGHVFQKDVNDIMRDYAEKYTSTDMYDKVKKMLGVTPTCLNWNGMNFYFQTLWTLSNPTNMGLNSSGEYTYEYPSSAMFIPDSPITVSKFGSEVNASIPNIGIGYVNYNGETNGKIFNYLKGMTTLEKGNLGTDKAGIFYYWLSEAMLFGGAWNQKFYYRKQRS